MHRAKFHLSVLFLATAAISVLAEVKRYDGYQVVRIFPENEGHLKYLSELHESSSSLDFWTDGIRRDFVDIMVSPAEQKLLKSQLTMQGMKSEVFIEDVQKTIDVTRQSSVPEGRAMDWESYHRLSDINAWLDEVAEANPGWVTTEIIGQSYLGNDLKLIRINPGNATRKFWIDGGIHAREWISSAVATYIINELVNNYEENKDLADAFDWHILPMHNPDGFEYSHTDDRMWRKTRTDHDSFWGCRGADPNRNFGFHWQEAGSSSDKCSEIYGGPEAFSEPSCAVVGDFAQSLNADGSVVGYITLHSYSQLWMCPFGYTGDYPENYDELSRVGRAAVAALEAVHGTQYEYGTSADILYYSSGTSRDWAYGAMGVPYVYTIELRDTGNYGFLLPADQIIPTGEETFAGIKAAALAILDA